MPTVHGFSDFVPGLSQEIEVLDAGIAGKNPLIEYLDEGDLVATDIVSIDFVGAGVTLTDLGGGALEVNVPGGGTGSGSSVVILGEEGPEGESWMIPGPAGAAGASGSAGAQGGAGIGVPGTDGIDGESWMIPGPAGETPSLAGLLVAADNLSDVLDATVSRGNLGLGTIATQNDSAVTITGNMEFNQHQALQFRLENRTSDPGSPAVGQMWLRTDLP